jgi:hypothetical protein
VEADAARYKAEASASLRSSSLELSHAQAALDAAVTELASTRASAKDAVVQVFVFLSRSFFFFGSPLFQGTFVGAKESCPQAATPTAATGRLSPRLSQQRGKPQNYWKVKKKGKKGTCCL